MGEGIVGAVELAQGEGLGVNDLVLHSALLAHLPLPGHLIHGRGQTLYRQDALREATTAEYEGRVDYEFLIMVSSDCNLITE